MKLHNAQDAIKQGIEGGYRPKNAWQKTPEEFVQSAIDEYVECLYEQTMCDPLFWQSLGKARGWDKEPLGTPDGGYANISWESEGLEWFLNHLQVQDETKFWESLP